MIIRTRLSADEAAQIQRQAQARGISVSQLVTWTLREHLLGNSDHSRKVS